MRLSKIKIAGFKSFVDPTVVQFPGNLAGVVGPNGCGKSNIIDAARWVMGEISAKHLRGDSMTDVIFNGSANRKPVGTASVELVFDNSDGAIGGPYSTFAEVSLRREVGRDAQSTYLINGVKCRRKDITQLFLGTGLGSRSYAVIEQGMISRLIEARPDDMRAFVEEAAGVSRYKERRRETESRIAHTRENLDRLNDLREEVEKQIRHLQRQAGAARRYRRLKERERQLQAELLALRLNEVDADLGSRDALQRERDTALQAVIAELRRAESEIEKARARHAERNDQLASVQERYYQSGAEASRTEQSLQHARELRQRQRADFAELERSLVETGAMLGRDQAQADELSAFGLTAQQELQQARATEQAAAAALQAAEHAMQEWQQEWGDYSAAAAEVSRKTLVERTRIEQLELGLARLLAQRQRLEAEHAALMAADLQGQLAALSATRSQAESQAAAAQQELAGVIGELQEVRERERRAAGGVDEARAGLQGVRDQVVSLEALQQAALGQAQGQVTQWLAGHGLGGRPRLANELSVERGWERAVETVLGSYLEAVCVDGIDAVSSIAAGLEAGGVTFLGRDPGTHAAPRAGALAAKVQSPPAVAPLLGDVLAVESLRDALAMRAGLRPGQSVVTRDGLWLGPNWLRVCRDQDVHAGVIARAAELRTLRAAADESQRRFDAEQRALEAARASLRSLEERRERLQAAANESHRSHSLATGQFDALKSRMEQEAERLARMAAERQVAETATAADEAEVREARQRLEAGLAQMSSLDDRRVQLEETRGRLKASLDQARADFQAGAASAQQVAIRVESQRSTLATVQTSIERLTTQIAQFQNRRSELESQLTSGGTPIDELDRRLKELLSDRLEVEKQLAESRRAVEAADAVIRDLEQHRIERETSVEQARDALEQVRLGAHEVKVRRESLLEQFAATRLKLEEVREQLPPEAEANAWAEQLAEVTAGIERLGAVNLASIDELKEQSERKEYLDKQFADLNDALATLDQAIHKIDRETRTRFRDTFERINSGLKEKFPRLFGGGSAYLELVGDDPLSAGVAVMARPPGKRISTISQLSGGEKALTAVALVFSIFELNPAPFCLLDEVDAPLDDHNVSRFCDIVRDMSSRVQFIFITHNKATMELAQHLIGVTMNEPGVSRLVSVDVDEAVRMAAS